MKDQCDKLRELGVAAWQLNSALPAAEIEAAEQAIAAGEAKIVFTTPERLAEPEFREQARRGDRRACSSSTRRTASRSGATTSGRPSSRSARRSPRLGRPRVLALTATATEAVNDDILASSASVASRVINTGLYRPNLHYSVDAGHAREQEARARGRAGRAGRRVPGIIYAATVKTVEDVHAALQRGRRVGSALYHGRCGATDAPRGAGRVHGRRGRG